MKNLFLIGGPMGVGKTRTSQILKLRLSDCVYLDGDRCWDADPFIVTEETKEMVTDNICYLLNNFIKCSRYKNIVFTWVMHTDDIIDSILSRINKENIRVINISLVAFPDIIISRLEKDIALGKRKEDVIERSLDRLKSFENVNSIKIDTSDLTTSEVAEKIAKL